MRAKVTPGLSRPVTVTRTVSAFFMLCPFIAGYGASFIAGRSVYPIVPGEVDKVKR